MLYDNIKKRCDEHGITICALEREIGISNGVIGKWRSTTPRMDTLQRVAGFFHCTVDELVTACNTKEAQ